MTYIGLLIWIPVCIEIIVCLKEFCLYWNTPQSDSPETMDLLKAETRLMEARDLNQTLKWPPS